jgi:hypothetical protein
MGNVGFQGITGFDEVFSLRFEGIPSIIWVTISI